MSLAKTLKVMASAGCTAEQMVAVAEAYEAQELQRQARQVPWPRLRAMAFERDGHVCGYCQDTDGPFEVDHIVPKSDGGEDVLSNVTVSCRSCNRAKKDRQGEEWDVVRSRREKDKLRKRASRSGKRVTSTDVHGHLRTSADTPVPPVSDKEIPPTPPKEINSSPLTPKTTLPGVGEKIDFDRLTAQIEASGNGKIQPHSLIVVGPVAELVASGVSLELDVLPTIRAVSSRLNKTVNLSYFLGPIREAYEKRIGVTANLPKPKELDNSELAWANRLRFARSKRIWSTAELGPRPGHPGCRVPASLLIEGDGDEWTEIENRSAA